MLSGPTRLFYLCEVHSHWMERVCISRCLLAVPLRLHTCLSSSPPSSASPGCISLPPSSCSWSAEPCTARVFLFCDGALLRMPLFLSLCPSFQPCQLRFRQSQWPFTSSTEGSPLHPQSSVPGTVWQFPAPWLAACRYGWPLLGHTWRPVSLTY